MVSVPNVAHFDIGLSLLCGQWDPLDRDGLKGTTLRHYTRGVLERLFERCGWKITATDDSESIYSSRYSAALHGQLPEAMSGALRVLAQSTNADWAVEHFVWALTPIGVDDPPSSYADAVAGPSELPDRKSVV